MEADREDAISVLLGEAQEAHGEYEAAELDGVYDREWPRWYADYAVDHGIGTLLGHEVTADVLAQFLGSSFADFEAIDAKSGQPWAAYTARRIAAEL
jgi:hypothetical protein